MLQSDTYYPSVRTAYYATGQWLEKGDALYKSTFSLTNQGKPNENLVFNGIVSETRDSPGRIFRGDLTCATSEVPTSVRDSYWVQAPVPACVRKHFLSITNNSGKFLLFVNANKLESIWKSLVTAYNEGKLGYGLQCTTIKNDDYGQKLIIVHTIDAFNMEDVAKVAWGINKALGDWKGTLHYITDRSTKANYKLITSLPSSQKNISEISPLYSIISSKFQKSKKAFTIYFKAIFVDNAQARQNLLKDKSTKKFE